jgi:Dolichyl-phosphate-mannose-protein mannosyltransferase
MIVESMERSRPRHRRALPALARTPVGLVACGLAALLLATSNGYGYHRDELYFRMLGQHPAWGYVDQPPLTPLLGRLATAVFGDHLWALRLPATACTVATAVLVALTARELGGGRVAQTLAALGAGSAELIFGHLLLTSPVDDVVWSAVLLFVIRALTRAHELLPAQHRVGTSLPAQRSSATRIKEGPALRVGRFGGNHRGGYLSINMLATAAPHTSPWLPEGSTRNLGQAA